MTALAVLLATVAAAAEVARCESSHAWADAAAVLQTAVNRANESGIGLHAELRAANQYSDHCPAEPRAWHPRHVLLGVQALTGTLDVPGWALTATHFSAPDEDDQCERWGLVEVGRIANVFCGPATVAARSSP